MKKIFIILSFLIATFNCFSQNVQSNNSFIFQPTTNPTTSFWIKNGIGKIDSGWRVPIDNRIWTPTGSGWIRFNQTLSAMQYYNADSAAWLLIGGGSGGITPSLATLDNGYGIIGGQYDPYGLPLTWSIDTSLLATINYVNNIAPADTIFNANYIVDSITNTPPSSPVDSSYVLVGTNPTGVFINHENQVAQRIGTGWAYTIPSTNDKLINAANDVIYVWNGTAWVATATPILNNRQPQKVNINIQPQNGFNTSFKIRNQNVIQLKNDRNVYFPQFIGLPSNNLLSIDSATGKLKYDTARNLLAGTNITFDTSAAGITINATGGGGGSETWEQTLTNQDSTPFTTDNTVDFGGKNLQFVNSGVFVIDDGYLDGHLGLTVNGGLSSLGGFNDTASYGHIVQYINDKFNVRSFSSREGGGYHDITIVPDSIKISNKSGNQLNLQINNLDSSNADANNVAWFDENNVLHRGHISGGSSSGGISQLGSPAYGLTRTNDSTYIVDTTVIASQIRLTNSLATKLNISDTAAMLSPYLKSNVAAATYVPLTRTVNGKALSSNITLGLASSDFANQGTTTTVLHGNASGNPSFSSIVNADITNATIDPTTKLSTTGTPSSTTYLRGDNTWATVSGGGGSPAGSYNFLQLNRNSLFDATDSLKFVSGNGLSVTNRIFNGSTANNHLTLRGNISTSGNTATSPNLIFRAGNVGAGDTAAILYNNGFINYAPNLTGATASPFRMSFGSNYGSSAAGSFNNNKWIMFGDANSPSNTEYGIGMYGSFMQVYAGNGGGISFWTNGGTHAMDITSGGVVSPLQGLAVTGAITGSSTLQLGHTSATSTATPLILNTGLDFGSNATYSASNMKLQLYTGYGLTMQSGAIGLQAPSGATVGFAINSVKIGEISSTGFEVVGKLKVTTGTLQLPYVSKAVDYTATTSDAIIEVTATGKTITLPTAASIAGTSYTIKLTASGSCTVATTSSQTIDGSTTYSLSAQYKYVTVMSNGTNWIITANN